MRKMILMFTRKYKTFNVATGMLSQNLISHKTDAKLKHTSILRTTVCY